MISVIIPAYNVQDYIAECLDSILNQTYKDLEIIVVDDGSTDNTPQILEEYAKKYPQIHILTQQNSGQSVARNWGLRESSGDYIVFVDSDDWLATNNSIEMLYEKITETSADFVQAGLAFKKGKVLTEYKIQSHGLTKGRDILYNMLEVKDLYTSPWAKIYSSEFLKDNNLNFIEGLVNEDTAFSICIAAKAKQVAYLNALTYVSRERDGSTSREASSIRMLDTMHKVMNQTRCFLKTNDLFDSKVSMLFEARYVRSMLYNLLQSAQRNNFKTFNNDHRYCVSKTDYIKLLPYRKQLPLAHRTLSYISQSPFFFFLTAKLMKFAGFKMH